MFTMPESMSNSVVCLLVEMACSTSHVLSAQNLFSSLATSQFAEVADFLLQHRILTPGHTTGTFTMDSETRNLIMMELKSMPKFPIHMESLLRLVESKVPANPDDLSSINFRGSYPSHTTSILRILTEVCAEHRLSTSSLDLIVSITSRVSRILIERGSHIQAGELAKMVLKWGSHALSSKPLASNAIRKGLAIAERYGGQLHRAEQLEYEIWKQNGTLLGVDHVETLHSLNNYAITLKSQNRYLEAEEAHWKALSIKEEIFGPHHLETLVTLTNLGRCLQARGLHKFAERHFRRVLEGRQSLLGQNDPAILRSMSNLGDSLYFQGRYQDAEKAYRDCLLGRMTELGKDNLDTIKIKSNLVIALGYQGKSTEAEILHREVIISFDHLLGPGHYETIRASQNFARFLSDQHQYTEAESILRACTTRAEQSLGLSHPRTFGVWFSIAEVLRRQEKYNEGLEFAIRSRDGRIKLFGFQDPDAQNSIRCVEQLLIHIRQDPDASHGGL